MYIFFRLFFVTLEIKILQYTYENKIRKLIPARVQLDIQTAHPEIFFNLVLGFDNE